MKKQKLLKKRTKTNEKRILFISVFSKLRLPDHTNAKVENLFELYLQNFRQAFLHRDEETAWAPSIKC